MKYFYIRDTGTISGNVGKNINIITKEEQLVSSINKGGYRQVLQSKGV